MTLLKRYEAKLKRETIEAHRKAFAATIAQIHRPHSLLERYEAKLENEKILKIMAK